MAKIYPMFSSSKGNSTYIGNASGGVLVDAGASYKKIFEALCREEIPLSNIKAVLVTHEHNDHIKGLKVLLKKTGALLLASRETVYALEFAGIIDDNTNRVYIDEQTDYEIGEFKINRFATSHDCMGSSGYTVRLSDQQTVAVCTDLGIVTEEVEKALLGADVVMLESNHDPVMLRLGPYTPELKIRVSGDKGHLSNAVSADLLAKLYKGGTRRFILAHLSENNNTPEKAESSARASLFDAGAKSDDYILYIAPPEKGRVITF